MLASKWPEQLFAKAEWRSREETPFILLYVFFFSFGPTMSHVRPQFPNQGSNLCPLHWESRVNHWTTREVPDTATFLSEPFSISLA